MEAGAGRQAVTSTSSLLLPEKSEDGGHIYDDDAPYGDDNALIPGRVLWPRRSRAAAAAKTGGVS